LQQFYDLCNLLSILTPPAEDHAIVFNGDFVDRGSWSVEVALTLFAYKWLYPKRIFLNRGNHETSDMNKVYGFEVSSLVYCVCEWGLTGGRKSGWLMFIFGWWIFRASARPSMES
jgi:hypothetical protein